MTRAQEPPSGLDDAELVRAAREGSDWAQAAIYHRYVRMVYATAAKLTPWTSEVEDTVQEVFVVTLERLDAIRDPHRLAGWLKTLTVRCAWEVSRRHRLRRRLGLVPSTLVDYDQCISPSASPEAAAELRELLRALRNLPAELRIAWSLRRIERCTVDEIATQMELSPSTVKRRLAQADRRLEKLGLGGRDE